MKSELPIIDAEFTDLPTLERPQTAHGRAKGLAKVSKVGRARVKAPRGPEGRIDKLASGLIAKMLAGDGPIAPEVQQTLDKAATAIFGSRKASGPEWELIKQVMNGR